MEVLINLILFFAVMFVLLMVAADVRVVRFANRFVAWLSKVIHQLFTK
jgi:hypothetical protein